MNELPAPGDHGLERALDRLLEEGAIPAEKRAHVREILEGELALNELGANALRAAFWSDHDLFARDQDYEGHIDELRVAIRGGLMGVRNTVGASALRRVIDDELAHIASRREQLDAGKGSGKIGPPLEAQEELVAWARRLLLACDHCPDRREVFGALAEQFPHDAIRVLESMDEGKAREIHPDDLTPLLTCPDPSLRSRAQALLPKLASETEVGPEEERYGQEERHNEERRGDRRRGRSR